jgi:hypothetical protein
LTSVPVVCPGDRCTTMPGACKAATAAPVRAGARAACWPCAPRHSSATRCSPGTATPSRTHAAHLVDHDEVLVLEHHIQRDVLGDGLRGDTVRTRAHVCSGSVAQQTALRALLRPCLRAARRDSNSCRTVQGSGGSSATSTTSPGWRACEGLVTGRPFRRTRPALMLALILARLTAGSAAER